MPRHCLVRYRFAHRDEPLPGRRAQPNTRALLEGPQDAAANTLDDSSVGCAAVLSALTWWTKATRPLQRASEWRGKEYPRARAVVQAVRSCAVDISNSHDLENVAICLTEAVFLATAHLPRCRAGASIEPPPRTEPPAPAAGSVAAEGAGAPRPEVNAPPREKTPAAFEVTLYVGFGASRLRVSADGVEYRGVRLPLESIAAIRWGRPFQGGASAIGSQASNARVVFLRSEREQVSIVVEEKATYERLMTRLWPAVAYPLLRRLLRGWQKAEWSRLGSVTISDDGVVLEKPRVLRRPNALFSPWRSVHIQPTPRELVVSDASGGFTGRWPYEDVENIQLLQLAVEQVLLTPGMTRLSDLLVI